MISVPTPLLLLTLMQSSVIVDQVEPASDSKTAGRSGEIISNPQSPTSGESVFSATDQVQIAPQLPTESLEQLSTADRATVASPTLSSRTDSVRISTTAVEGSDRCDAGKITEQDSAYCERIIENRSSEYAGPDAAALSPEQRLLGERRIQEGSTGPEAAARRLANGRESPDNSENQEIASIVLSAPTPNTDVPTNTSNEPADEGAATQTLIDAIVTSMSGALGPQ